MSVLLTRTIEFMVLPPGGVFFMLLLGIVLLYWRPVWGRRTLWVGILFFYVTSIYATSGALMDGLESHPALTDQAIQASPAQAIVVMGSGRYPSAPEYGGRDTLSTGGLARVRYGAWLHRKTGLPILVSGGRPHEEEQTEAFLMKQVLEQEFNTPVRWMEGESGNSLENAVLTRKMLHKEGIDHIFLVTHAWHMPRAVWAFQDHAGLKVTPAPTLFQTKGVNRGLLDWIPYGGALGTTGWAIHERMGRVWYQLKTAF